MMETLFTIAMILSVFVALTMAYDVCINKRKRLPRMVENAATSSFLVAVMLWIVYLLCWAFIEMGF